MFSALKRMGFEATSKEDQAKAEEEFNTMVEMIRDENGQIRCPDANLLNDNPELAPTLIRIYMRYKEFKNAQKTTKKGSKMDHGSLEFIKYVTENFPSALAGDKRMVITKGPLKVSDMGDKERNLMTKVLAGEARTVSDVTGDSDNFIKDFHVKSPEAGEERKKLEEDDKDGAGRGEEEDEEEVLVSKPSKITGDLDSISPSDLILLLAEGLQYDKFDSAEIRDIVVKNKRFTLNTMIIMCQAYIFVGNNTGRLGQKVKDTDLGSQVVDVLNMFGVKGKKTDKKSLTLARIGISFAPVVWALRNIMYGKGKLQNSGVVSSTPLVLQDVALSGVSKRISNGDSIVDFLNAFNKTLTKHRERNEKEKSSEEDIKEDTQKWLNLARAGLDQDKLLLNWDYNDEENKGMTGVQRFYVELTYDEMIQ